MSSDKPEEAAPRDAATIKMPTRPDRPASTLHSYVGGWQPPTLDALQKMLPQYQFIEMLGAGGMGAVYKARQISLDRLVAIKILPPGLEDGSGANFTERFKQEARTMAKMNHPCIVDVYDFGETGDGQFYFVMEFVEGTDVQKMIRANKRISPEDALSITAHVCDALEYAHSRGVIHRDIKPANVLISAEGSVKIADFGLAKAVDSKSHELTRSNMAMGTPHFMAPEAMMADVKVDSRADLYAVGVMLHNMLTGEIPTGRFELPSKKTGCDRRFDRIVDRAMQADRDQRYQHASEIRKELDTILTTPVVAEGDESIPVVQPKELMRGQKMKVVTDSVLAAKPPVVPPDEIPAQKPKQDAPAKKEPSKAGPDAAKAAPKKSAAPPTAAPKQEPPAPPPQKSPLKSSAPPASPGLGKIIGIMSGIAAVIVGALVFYSTRSQPRVAAASGRQLQPAAQGAATAVPTTQTRSLPPDALQQLEPGAIRLWDSPGAIVSHSRCRWENGVLRLDNGCPVRYDLVSRDAVIRADILMNPDSLSSQIGLRKGAGALSGNFYSLIVRPGSNEVSLASVVDRKYLPVRRWPLPREYRPDEWAQLELRVVGDELTVKMDGQTLGVVHDTQQPQRGSPHLYATSNGFFRNIVYIPLDKTAGTSVMGAPGSLPSSDAFANEVAALPAEQQVARVIAELRSLNPEFDGKERHAVSNGVVVDLGFSTEFVTNITPVAALSGLKVLSLNPPHAHASKLADLRPLARLQLLLFHCVNAGISDLLPLKGQPLEDLDVHACHRLWTLTPLEGMKLRNVNLANILTDFDYSVLKGMPLEYVDMIQTKFSDLSVLRGAPLRWLRINSTDVKDLSPIAGAPLEHLDICALKISDLTPLQNAPLRELLAEHTKISDLAPLRKAPLEVLSIIDTQVRNLAPIRGMPLREINLDNEIARTPENLEILGSLKSLTSINREPAAEFWKQRDATTPSTSTPGNDGFWQDAINLLPLADPQKDAIQGKWSWEGSGLKMNGGGSWLLLPYRPPAEYDFRTEFTRTVPSDAVQQTLACGEHIFSWAVFGQGGTNAGFEHVEGKRLADNRSRVTMTQKMDPKHRFVSLVQVRKDGVKGFLDGQLLVDWKTDYRDMNLPEWNRMRDPGLLGMGANGGETIFHRAEVREITGKGTFTRDAPLNEADSWKNAINLLPLIDPARDTVRGDWIMEQGGLVGDHNEFATIEIPYRPPAEYDYRVEFTAKRGGNVGAIHLAKAGHNFTWNFFGAGGHATFGFEIVGGKSMQGNPTTTLLDPVEVGRRYVTLVQVRNNEVRAFLDGRQVSTWKTDYSDLDAYKGWQLRDPTLLGLGSQSTVTFHSIQVREVTGKGSFTRSAASNK